MIMLMSMEDLVVLAWTSKALIPILVLFSCIFKKKVVMLLYRIHSFCLGNGSASWFFIPALRVSSCWSSQVPNDGQIMCESWKWLGKVVSLWLAIRVAKFDVFCGSSVTSCCQPKGGRGKVSSDYYEIPAGHVKSFPAMHRFCSIIVCHADHIFHSYCITFLTDLFPIFLLVSFCGSAV
ncbi:hypothetical protein Tco_0746135 [Tanacetum coccineum]